MSIWTFSKKADQGVTAGPIGLTQTLAWGANNTLNDFLLCVVSWTGTQTVSVSDTHNSWATLGSISYGTNQNVQAFWVLACVAATTPTVTATFSATGAANVQLSLAEETPPAFQQVATALDVSATGTGTGTAMASASTSANTNANELVIGYAATGTGGATLTAGTGFTLRTTSASRGNLIEDNLSSGYSSTGLAALATTNTSAAWACGILVFKPGSGVTANLFANAQALESYRFSPPNLALGNTMPRSGQLLPIGRQ
jgi:hypothetical protein